MQNTTKFTFTILFIVLSFSIQSQTVYSFAENWKAKNYAQPLATKAKSLTTSTSPNATVTISTSVQLAPVLSTQFGVNTTFRNGSDQLTRSSLYSGIVTTMRFPAGSGSNTYFWDGNIPTSMGTYYDQQDVVQSVSGINGANSNYMTPELFVQFKNTVNGQPIVVVNYFYARYGLTTGGTRAARVQQAADYAAAFVRKMNVTLGAGIKYWEIGNECYGKWEIGYDMVNTTIGTVTGKEYGEDFRVFAAAMKAVDPAIKVGAIVKDVDDSWNAGVLPEVQNTADFLSVHEYFTTVNDATSANLLAAVSQISGIKSTLNSCITKYTTKNSGYFPIALTEFNARGPYNASMINGLFITQILGEIIKNGVGLSCLWVSEWNWNAAENATHSFLAKADPDQDDFTPRQAYIPFYYYSKCFGDYMVSSSSNNSSIISYASTFSGGQVGVVLVNTSSTAKTVKLTFSNSLGAVKITNFDWYEFYANTIEPTVSGYKKFYINGQTSVTAGGGPELSTVKPYKYTPATNSVFSMQPYSVYFVVATPENITSLHQQAEKSSERIVPSVIRDTGCYIQKNQLTKFELYNSDGRLLKIGNSQHLSLVGIKNGLYILKAKFGDIIIVNKFLKQ